MSAIEGPYELLELEDQRSLTLTPEKWLQGTMTIVPRFSGGQTAKLIQVLRLWVPASEKPTGMPYWDVTSQTLIAQVVPLLPDIVARHGKITIKAFGRAPAKRFTVEVLK